MVERSRDWLRQARRDVRSSRHSLEGGFYEWACFCAQQAGEKSLKALYQRLGADVHGYSVLGMVRKLPKRFKAPQRFLDMGRDLDKAYIPTRYPNAHPEGAPFEFFTHNDAERLIGYARQILQFCESLLSEIKRKKAR